MEGWMDVFEAVERSDSTPAVTKAAECLSCHLVLYDYQTWQRRTTLWRHTKRTTHLAPVQT